MLCEREGTQCLVSSEFLRPLSQSAQCTCAAVHVPHELCAGHFLISSSPLSHPQLWQWVPQSSQKTAQVKGLAMVTELVDLHFGLFLSTQAGQALSLPSPVQLVVLSVPEPQAHQISPLLGHTCLMGPIKVGRRGAHVVVLIG